MKEYEGGISKLNPNQLKCSSCILREHVSCKILSRHDSVFITSHFIASNACSISLLLPGLWIANNMHESCYDNYLKLSISLKNDE